MILHVKQRMPFTDVEIPLGVEVAAVKLHIKQSTMCICSLYIPPDFNNDTLRAHFDKLISYLPIPFIVSTDSNAHRSLCGSEASDRRRNICDWVERKGLMILNTGEPTFATPKGNYTVYTHINLTIAMPDIAASLQWSTYANLATSDHFPIRIIAGMEAPRKKHSQHWKFETADWKGFQNVLNLRDVEFTTPSEVCGIFVERLKGAALHNIRETKEYPSNSYCKCWWNKECSETVRNINKALSRHKRHRESLKLFIEFKKARAYFRRAVVEAKRKCWEEYLQNLKPNAKSGSLWKTIKAINNNRHTRSIVLKENGVEIAEPSLVANELGEYFAKISDGISDNQVFNDIRAIEEQKSINFIEDNTEEYNKNITMSELVCSIATGSSKTAGPDKLPYEIYKHLNDAQLKNLLQLFNYIFNSGLPAQWNEASVIPIKKPNKIATETKSYRPIALTNCMGKLLEKIINWRLQCFMVKYKYMI